MNSKETNNGKKGGLLKGKRHYDKDGKPLGGIKAVVTDTGKQVELEGGEVIINREASKKHWKTLSKINQSAGNGVAILPPAGATDTDPEEYKDGGNIIKFNPNNIPNKWILQYAKKIKSEHPKVWALGGNIFGNEAFENLKRVYERGYWLDSEEWMYIKWRSYVARHKKDFRIEGVIAMLKWVDKVDKGWDYMKQLIEAEITKKEKKPFGRKAAERMKKGGAVTYKQKYNKRFDYDEDETHDLKEVAKDTGVSKKGLQKIYNKGVGAYKTNPESVRPTVKSKEQWAMGRVYSAVMGGKAARIDDKELKMANGGMFDDNCIEYINSHEAVLNNGYYCIFKNTDLYVGKNEKQVPNIKSFCLVSYNSGGQKNLKVTDTINPIGLSGKLQKLIGGEKPVSQVIIHEFIQKAKRLTKADLAEIAGGNIIIANRDTIECENLSTNKMAEGGGVAGFDWESLYNPSPEEQKIRDEEYKKSLEQEKEDWYKNSKFSKKWAAKYQDAVSRTVKEYLDSKATYDDWSSRQYKSNKGTVFLGGDDVFGEQRSIGSINEGRRQRVLRGSKMLMDESIETLKELGFNNEEITNLIEPKDEYENGGELAKGIKAEQEYYQHIQNGGETYSEYLAKLKIYNDSVAEKENIEKQEYKAKQKEENEKREEEYKSKKYNTIKKYIENDKDYILENVLSGYRAELEKLKQEKQSKSRDEEIAFVEKMILQKIQQVDDTYKVANVLYKIVDGKVEKKYNWEIGDEVVLQVSRLRESIETTIEQVIEPYESYKVEKREGIHNQFINYDNIYPKKVESDCDIVDNEYPDNYKPIFWHLTKEEFCRYAKNYEVDTRLDETKARLECEKHYKYVVIRPLLDDNAERNVFLLAVETNQLPYEKVVAIIKSAGEWNENNKMIKELLRYDNEMNYQSTIYKVPKDVYLKGDYFKNNFTKEKAEKWYHTYMVNNVFLNDTKLREFISKGIVKYSDVVNRLEESGNYEEQSNGVGYVLEKLKKFFDNAQSKLKLKGLKLILNENIDVEAKTETERQYSENVEPLKGGEYDLLVKLIDDNKNSVQYNKTKLEKLAKQYGVIRQNDVKEIAELSISVVARSISLDTNDKLTPKEKYDKIVKLYENQVNLSHRTSESIMLQQYSTPAPIAFVAGLYCNFDEKGLYFEPSAGNGLLTIAGAPYNFIVNEVDSRRSKHLKTIGFKEVLKQDAGKPFVGFEKKFDAIITNPPFGKTEATRYGNSDIKSLEQVMALRALDTMKDNGKAAIIIGGHTEFDSEGRIQAGKNRIFFVYLYKHYNVMDVINISGRYLYSRQGTAFNTRLILIDGRKETPSGFPPLETEKTPAIMQNSSTPVTDFNTLWDRISKQF